MPHYDYLCRTCGKTFEFFQPITSDALTHCPEALCEQSTKGIGIVERRISKGVGLIFNGSGFYLTDYVKTGGVSGSKESGSKESGSTTSTPAPAADTKS